MYMSNNNNNNNSNTRRMLEAVGGGGGGVGVQAFIGLGGGECEGVYCFIT